MSEMPSWRESPEGSRPSFLLILKLPTLAVNWLRVAVLVVCAAVPPVVDPAVVPVVAPVVVPVLAPWISGERVSNT